jgi:hypothetical protein
MRGLHANCHESKNETVFEGKNIIGCRETNRLQKTVHKPPTKASKQPLQYEKLRLWCVQKSITKQQV